MYGGPSGRGMRGVVGGVVVEDAAGGLKVSNILHRQDLRSTNLGASKNCSEFVY